MLSPFWCNNFKWSTVICKISAFSSLAEPWSKKKKKKKKKHSISRNKGLNTEQFTLYHPENFSFSNACINFRPFNARCTMQTVCPNLIKINLSLKMTYLVITVIICALYSKIFCPKARDAHYTRKLYSEIICIRRPIFPDFSALKSGMRIIHKNCIINSFRYMSHHIRDKYLKS